MIIDKYIMRKLIQILSDGIYLTEPEKCWLHMTARVLTKMLITAVMNIFEFQTFQFVVVIVVGRSCKHNKITKANVCEPFEIKFILPISL